MRAPLHQRTEKIGACLADPFANGEGRIEYDTFTIPEGRRRRVYRPITEFWRKAGPGVNPKTMLAQLDAARGFASAFPLYARSRRDCGHCRGSESGQQRTEAKDFYQARYFHPACLS
jgi:hypothetical protein